MGYVGLDQLHRVNVLSEPEIIVEIRNNKEVRIEQVNVMLMDMGVSATRPVNQLFRYPNTNISKRPAIAKKFELVNFSQVSEFDGILEYLVVHHEMLWTKAKIIRSNQNTCSIDLYTANGVDSLAHFYGCSPDKILRLPNNEDGAVGVITILAVDQKDKGVAYFLTVTADQSQSQNADQPIKYHGYLDGCAANAAEIGLVIAINSLKKNGMNDAVTRLTSHQMVVSSGMLRIAKYGPSAGIALAAAFVSYALEKPIPTAVTMTGEFELNGRIGKIGGFKGKLEVVNKHGRNRVYYPLGNVGDFIKLPQPLQQYFVAARPVENFDQVYKHLFSDTVTQ